MTKQGERQIDLNTASADALRQVKGIGPALAARIIAYRHEHGGFADVSELVRVQGISARKAERLRYSVQVEPQAQPTAEPQGAALFAGRPDEETSEPIFFFGYPEFLQGSVRLTNTGDRRLRVAVLEVDRCALRTTERMRLEKIVTRPRLRPGETKSVPVTVAIDPTTAPGSYDGELVISGQRYPAVFKVAERTSVTIIPSRIILESRPGASFDKVLFVKNNGNVPLSLGDIGIVVLEDEDLSCRVIRGSASQLKDPDFDTTVGVVVNQLRKAYEDVEPLRIRTINKPVSIPPAATADVGIRIRIPESLPQGRDCKASFRVFDASVTVLLRSQFSRSERTKTADTRN